MTGRNLVNLFYSVNLNYLRDNPNADEFDVAVLKLFLLGLIETAYIKDSVIIHPAISTFLNAN